MGPSTSTSTLTNSILEGDGLRVSVKENIENDYELGDMLGSGAFAIVYKAVNKNTGEEVAVKKIKKNIVKESEIKVGIYFLKKKLWVYFKERLGHFFSLKFIELMKINSLFLPEPSLRSQNHD